MWYRSNCHLNEKMNALVLFCTEMGKRSVKRRPGSRIEQSCRRRWYLGDIQKGDDPFWPFEWGAEQPGGLREFYRQLRGYAVELASFIQVRGEGRDSESSLSPVRLC